MRGNDAQDESGKPRPNQDRRQSTTGGSKEKNQPQGQPDGKEQAADSNDQNEKDKDGDKGADEKKGMPPEKNGG